MCWASFFKQVLTFFVVLGFSLINFFLLSQFTNLGFSGNFFGLFVLSVFLASCMISFGIFLSAAAKRTIFAVILFISLVLSFVIFWGAHSLIMSLPGKNLTTLLIYTRLVLDNVNVLVQWISPLAYFVKGHGGGKPGEHRTVFSERRLILDLHDGSAWSRGHHLRS